ncbi:DEAD/DEAH box helicase family protein [Alphaproteobacteria bacterium]|nr:DEAD/DEAH box helicase family protein [Alphaproteobacteria bacterium]
MDSNYFFIKREGTPKIYAYSDKRDELVGLLKIGYTIRGVKQRIAEQYPTKTPGSIPYKIELEEFASRLDGTTFTDREVHSILLKNGFANPDGEWFRCEPKDVLAAIEAIRNRQTRIETSLLSFGMRPEQETAVQKTALYFEEAKNQNPSKPSRFLWNAKMRFGKTFTAYQLAKKMGWTRVLVVTFKPAVQHSWESDLNHHKDFQNWQFVTTDKTKNLEIDDKKPIVCFGSFQNLLGKNSVGGIKSKNEWVHEINWDCVILDEYHYGAWRQKATELFEGEEEEEIRALEGVGLGVYDEAILPITANHFLYLSGTPFRALSDGEFIEEQIFNWTYSDEQEAKKNFKGKKNPYSTMPKLALLTYQLPPALRIVANKGEYDEFDLSLFFKATGEYEKAKFVNENEVQKWLEFIRGAYLETEISSLKIGSQKPAVPFSHTNLLKALDHTLWYLPSIASCAAMYNLLTARHNKFYHAYKVNLTAGSQAGIGASALTPVLRSMDPPTETKTITLSCGKLTTGVTVRPWSGIFMLRNLSSPESYFQAAFRVQSPWAIANPNALEPNEILDLKEVCYVFDFAPNRALSQIVEYSCRLSTEEENPEKKVSDFINFLPVLAYDGTTMKEIDAEAILDIALSGTSATLLARRWESAMLVNVDNETLEKLLNNDQAMKALMNIEGFRSLSQDLRVIVNKTKEINARKKQANDRNFTKEEKKQLTDDQKEYKSKRKVVQEKLIKFATRIPVFMYLTDYREYSLRDVITKIEPELFKKVTGIGVDDFNLLLSLNLFNSALMNDAIYKFKRYEDSSLNYLGFTKHDQSKIGLFDTVKYLDS